MLISYLDPALALEFLDPRNDLANGPDLESPLVGVLNHIRSTLGLLAGSGQNSLDAT